MDYVDAVEIAELLNKHGHMQKTRSASDVQDEDFIYTRADGPQDHIVACSKVKKINWYMAEVTSLAYDPEHPEAAKELIGQVKSRATGLAARVVQATVVSTNYGLRRLLETNGFTVADTFHNERTRRNLTLMNCVLVQPQ